MKIAYLIEPHTIVSGKSNGIKKQAYTWQNILQSRGIEVSCISCWDDVEFGDYDVIHLFGSATDWAYSVGKDIRSKAKKFFYSPICDEINNNYLQRLKTYVGFQRLGVWSYPMLRKLSYSLFDKIFVRSDYEGEYISKAYHVEKDNIVKVPIAHGDYKNISFDCDRKEMFCFHMSSVYQSRKNVLRLAEASVKYQFPLVLAGSLGPDFENSKLHALISKSNNIQCLGFITEQEKVDLYKRAKVFALPSIKEGVGIVALDAALFGCNIVITNIGGPKEYFGDANCSVVNPYSIDEIGKAVTKEMNLCRDSLVSYVKSKCSYNVVADALCKAYTSS